MHDFDEKKLSEWITAMQLPLESTMEAMKEIEQSLKDADLLKGKVTDTNMSACLYVVCKKLRRARSMNEFCRICLITKCELCHAYQYLMNVLNLKYPQFSEDEYVEEGCLRLGFRSDVENEAKKIIKMAPPAHLNGTNAAVAIFLGATKLGVKVSKDEICKTLKLAPKTLSSVAHDFPTFL
ncbi:hypothetical protein ACOME3_001606 [Neoechinorhynchus agilis]